MPVATKPPFGSAPEHVQHIFLVTFATAMVPLIAGAFFFGWRAVEITVIAVVSAALIERIFYKVTRTPALLGSTHGYLIGLLVGLTLPAFVPWYVPVVASGFAIIVGKAIFGGVGHFLWAPALVGRLAVAVIFPVILTTAVPSNPELSPILARNRILGGDLLSASPVANGRPWSETPAPRGADALLVRSPSAILAGLTRTAEPAYSGIALIPPGLPHAKPTVLSKLPPMGEMIFGARPGAIGETCIVAIVIAGMYLIYRHYVKGELPLAIIASAAIVAFIAPVKLAGPNDTVMWVFFPAIREGFEVAMVYVSYQVLSGGLILAAFFLATEMTSRPVTTGGQILFGCGVGVLAMGGQFYTQIPIPAFMAVLIMNTFTPVIDAAWRPRVLGQKRWYHKINWPGQRACP